ncbi:MAG: glycosyltransferase [Chitinophagales bacterium]|nr:glycosyltransferase [Chitinophagales bacterium]
MLINSLVAIVIIIYIFSLLFIFCYSLVQLNLAITYLRNKRSLRKKNIAPPNSITDFPLVTIQLPIYNERYVVERLLDAVSLIEYPKDRLEIQVLDDSTDDTVQIIEKKMEQLKDRGFNIMQVRRMNRNGYKAGALSNGLKLTKGEFIAVFDSDFLPKPDFLLQTVPHFKDPQIGAIQTRWEHLNKNYSLLTKLQAFGLDAHFTVEQNGRNIGGHFINFNGTAGIWRKECITNSGGWKSDTLTEDLDLSYRAQLAGWKFMYIEKIGTPAELPLAMNALKIQQFRWNKGGAECAKKYLPSVLKRHDLKLSTKVHAVFHLLNSTVFIFILSTALLSIPMLFIKKYFLNLSGTFYYASFFLISVVILSLYYFTSLAQQEKRFPRNLFQFLAIFPLFLSISMGLALHNAIAVIEGFMGKKTAFNRTPKFNTLASKDSWKSNQYLENSITWMTILEGLLALYFTAGIAIGVYLKDYGLLPFHILLTFGFGIVFYYSLAHSRSISVAAK